MSAHFRTRLQCIYRLGSRSRLRSGARLAEWLGRLITGMGQPFSTSAKNWIQYSRDADSHNRFGLGLGTVRCLARHCRSVSTLACKADTAGGRVSLAGRMPEREAMAGA